MDLVFLGRGIPANGGGGGGACAPSSSRTEPVSWVQEYDPDHSVTMGVNRRNNECAQMLGWRCIQLQVVVLVSAPEPVDHASHPIVAFLSAPPLDLNGSGIAEVGQAWLAGARIRGNNKRQRAPNIRSV